MAAKSKALRDVMVIYRSAEDDCWIAHSLATDQLGTGQGIVEALADGIRAVEQVREFAKSNPSIAVQRKAPKAIQELARRAKPLPRELYEIKYPAPGDPELARRVQSLLAPVLVGLDSRWVSTTAHGRCSVTSSLKPTSQSYSSASTRRNRRNSTTKPRSGSIACATKGCSSWEAGISCITCTPTRGADLAMGCACAASGHTAAPPSSVIIERRFTAWFLPCFKLKG